MAGELSRFISYRFFPQTISKFYRNKYLLESVHAKQQLFGYVHPEHAQIKEMLRKQEKNAITRGAILAVGWGWGLDRFYEGDKKGGILSILGWGIVFTSFLFLKCSGIEYVDGVKDYSNYSPNPLIVLPLIAGLYGIYLILRKGFRLAKQFENSED